MVFLFLISIHRRYHLCRLFTLRPLALWRLRRLQMLRVGHPPNGWHGLHLARSDPAAARQPCLFGRCAEGRSGSLYRFLGYVAPCVCLSGILGQRCSRLILPPSTSSSSFTFFFTHSSTFFHHSPPFPNLHFTTLQLQHHPPPYLFSSIPRYPRSPQHCHDEVSLYNPWSRSWCMCGASFGRSLLTILRLLPLDNTHLHHDPHVFAAVCASRTQAPVVSLRLHMFPTPLYVQHRTKAMLAFSSPCLPRVCTAKKPRHQLRNKNLVSQQFVLFSSFFFFTVSRPLP